MKRLRYSLILATMCCCGVLSLRAADVVGGAAADAPVYTVADEWEFVAALGNDRVVMLAPDVSLNLTRVLAVEDYFRAEGRGLSDDLAPDEINLLHHVALNQSVYDGSQLTLVNFQNLTICGAGNNTIVVEPRYACVFHLYKCSNVRMENLTLGHTEEGYCQGAVVGLTDCGGVAVVDCDLYGCGTYGVEATGTENFAMKSSIIRDCSDGIMQLSECNDFLFLRCDFYRNREFTLVSGYMTKGLRFTDCRFYDNNPTSNLFGDAETTLDGCVIVHPTASLGNLELTSSVRRESVWTEEASVYLPERADVGAH